MFCDLRFGQIGTPSPQKAFIYSYKLIPDGRDLRVSIVHPPPLNGKLFNGLMSELWARVKGE